MFAGGTGTSGSSTEWAMSEIVRNPRVMKKLQEEIRRTFRGKETITETDLRNSDLKYLKLVMKEAIRLHPAAPLLVPRESIDTAELGGYVVPGSVAQTASALTFTITDNAYSIQVSDTGPVPAMFKAGQGVVLEGAMESDGLFHSDTLLVQHDGRYRPPEG